MLARKNPAARAEPDGGVGWFGSVYRRRAVKPEMAADYSTRDATAALQGLGPLGLTVRTRTTMVLPTGVRGMVSEALVMLRMGVRSQSGPAFRSSDHGDLEFVEAEVGHAAPAGDHLAREAGGAQGELGGSGEQLGRAAAFAQVPAHAGEGFIRGIGGLTGAGATLQDIAGIGAYSHLGDAGGLQLGFQAGNLIRQRALTIVGIGEVGQIGGEVRIVNILRQAIPDLEGEGHEGGGLGIRKVQQPATSINHHLWHCKDQGLRHCR
jgi:hypothetical protein